jgi:hypothetical protein
VKKKTLCPSVQKVMELTTEPCTMGACTWWKGNRCTARKETFEDAAKLLAKPVIVIPPCPIASDCRWNQDAVKEGKRACEVRLLGMLCEHQGGEWNTFDMAPFDEWDDES